MRKCRFRSPRELLSTLHTQARRRPWVIRFFVNLIPVVIAGSGILNLLSLMGGPLPTEPLGWFRDLFPLDFTQANRSGTLLLGFALVLTALHLTGMKRRALHLAFGLSLASALFHLSKAWDLEEALCSFAVAALLLSVQHVFRVGSGKPNLALALKRAALALAIAAAYGIAGFWLLEPREFGRNFHWWEAVARTFGVMLQFGDAGLSPRTPYAAWFLDSLYIISASAFLYSGVTLFRPVSYRFYQNDSDRELASKIAGEYGRSGQDFFKQWPDKSFFFSESKRSFVAYRVAHHYALVLGDPVGPEHEVRTTIEQFVDFCQGRGWRVGFHQVAADWIGLYESMGFHHLKIGNDAVVDLAAFSLDGSVMKELRNTVNRLDRLGFQVKRFNPPLEKRLVNALKRVSDEWLTIPGHRERKFTLGRFDPAYVAATETFVAFDQTGELAAFLNLIPSYKPGLATVDLMRRSRGSVNGVMDYLFAKVFLVLRSEGFQRFSLGMAPGGEPRAGEKRTVTEGAIDWIIGQFPAVFHSDSLRRFKAKYAPHWEPRYAVYRSPWDLPRLALALKQISEDGRELRSAA